MLVCLSSTIVAQPTLLESTDLYSVTKITGLPAEQLGYVQMPSTAVNSGLLSPTLPYPQTPSPPGLGKLCCLVLGAMPLPPSIQFIPLGRVFFPLQPVLGSSSALVPLTRHNE